MLEINTKLDYQCLKDIYDSGYSRIPIYENMRDNIVGILMVRDLILINPEQNIITIRQISSILIKNVIQIQANQKLEPVLAMFKKGFCHMAVVINVVEEEGKDPEYKKVGVITLEDIVEQILQEDIKDEGDLHGEIKQDAIRNKMTMMFRDASGPKDLSEEHKIAIVEYLQKHVQAFSFSRIKRESLYRLISKATIIDVETGQEPFSQTPVKHQFRSNPKFFEIEASGKKSVLAKKDSEEILSHDDIELGVKKREVSSGDLPAKKTLAHKVSQVNEASPEEQKEEEDVSLLNDNEQEGKAGK